jgi:hypothetical protein
MILDLLLTMNDGEKPFRNPSSIASFDDLILKLGIWVLNYCPDKNGSSIVGRGYMKMESSRDEN